MSAALDNVVDFDAVRRERFPYVELRTGFVAHHVSASPRFTVCGRWLVGPGIQRLRVPKRPEFVCFTCQKITRRQETSP